jgi:CheY-like chemotaxis protein
MGKDVLIVEDDEIIQHVLEWRLRSLGYSVCGKAATAEDAIRLADEKKPDLVLMDIDLKGYTDGIDAALAIKKKYQLPVVFITASSRDEDLERAKRVPPDGFIVKPFNDDDIRVALKLALE